MPVFSYNQPVNRRFQSQLRLGQQSRKLFFNFYVDNFVQIHAAEVYQTPTFGIEMTSFSGFRNLKAIFIGLKKLLIIFWGNALTDIFVVQKLENET